jgi:hypothetical protein
MVIKKGICVLGAILSLALSATFERGSVASANPRNARPSHVRALGELRNADVTKDAIARAIEAQAERELHRPIVNSIRLVSVNSISDAQVQALGIKRTTGRPLTVVLLHLRDTRGAVWEHQFVYDTVTHLCLGSTERSAFSNGRNKPTVPIAY